MEIEKKEVKEIEVLLSTNRQSKATKFLCVFKRKRSERENKKKESKFREVKEEELAGLVKWSIKATSLISVLIVHFLLSMQCV